MDEGAGENGGERDPEAPAAGKVKVEDAGDLNIEIWGGVGAPANEKVCSAVRMGILGRRSDCSG